MSEQTTVTYSLEAVLKEIASNQKELNVKLEANQKETNANLKELNAKLETLAIGQARLEEKVNSIDTRLTKVETTQEFLVKEVSDLKGVKSLIVPVIVAVITAAMTLIIKVIPLG
jgi:chromosome segregation ATPase